ncbi:hypothetical protein BH11PAT1_BH11PAT1_5830 [soil metagenome]
MAVLSRRFLLPTIAIAIIYIVLVTYSMNIAIIKDTLLGEYSIFYKVKLMTVLLEGMWTAMSPSGLIALFLVAILTGANLTFVAEKFTTLKKFDKLHMVIGGNSLLGIVGSGCAACGLPILSLFGLSGSIMYLPFHGAELSYISIIFLGISLYLLIKGQNQACAIEYGKKRKL